MKKLLVTLLLLMLCLLCGCGSQETKDAAAPAQDTPAAAPEKSPLQTAYEEGKAFELVQAELPAEGVALGGMPVSLAPDGETWLWQAEDGQMYMLRGGRALAVKPAPERGAGDPDGKLDKLFFSLNMKFLTPDVSWSPDGRYAVLSILQAGDILRINMDVVLLDAENGEAFRGTAYAFESGEQYGDVKIAAFDRTGGYVYYVVAKLPPYKVFLARYAMDTGTTELLCELPKDPVHGLFETADGGWTLACGGWSDIQVCFAHPDESGKWRADSALTIVPSVISALYLHASVPGISLLEYNRKDPGKCALVRTEENGSAKEVLSGQYLGCGCPSPDGRYLLLNLQNKENRQVSFVLLDPASMQTAEVSAPESLTKRVLIKTDRLTCMEWNAGCTLLIRDADSSEVRAWRLEIR